MFGQAPPESPPSHLITLYLHDILASQRTILANQVRIMAAIDDLNAASAKLQTDVGTLLANQPAPGTPDAAIEAVTAQLTALDAQVVAATPAPVSG